MKNQNLLAFALACILLFFTYKYFVRNPYSFVVYQAVIGVGLVAIAMTFAYFLIIKLIGYFIISGKIYPHPAFYILWPFVVLTFIGWLVYGFIYVRPFGSASDFIQIFKDFVGSIVLFIAICSLIIGVAYFYFGLNPKINDAVLLRNNLLYLGICFVAFLVSVVVFYITNSIKQPDLSDKYSDYKTLDKDIESQNYLLEQFIISSEYNLMTEPYLLPNQNELIIIETYRSGNYYVPIKIIYRIDKNGQIIETFNEDEAVVTSPIKNVNFFPLICKGGILTDYDGKKLISWIFDGNKKKQDVKEIKCKADWKFDTLDQNTADINIVHFYKTAAIYCNGLDTVKYNGNRYYNLMIESETIKIKVDSVYSKSKYDQTHNCKEKKLEYYSPVGFNFSLLRVNEHKYYIIKAKK